MGGGSGGRAAGAHRAGARAAQGLDLPPGLTDHRSVMVTLSPGAVIGGYRIETVVGRGGMGVVYRATQARLERPVAIKVITPELAENVEFRRRFERESKLAARIEHPHVIPVYEAGEAGGRLFIAMRLVDGTDLQSLVAREGRLRSTAGCRHPEAGRIGPRCCPRARAGAPRRQARERPRHDRERC